MNHCPPGPQVFHGGRFEFFRKFAEIFANECSSPVNDTGDKLFTGVNDNGEQFTTGDKDTGEQLSPVTLAINLLPVTRTRTPWMWGAAKDRRKLKGTNL
jgi:hypothetical protein